MSDLQIDIIVYAVRLIIVFGAVLTSVPFLVLLERKLLGWIQQRPGPNRLYTWGILQPFVDGIKLFLKEDVRPASTRTALHTLAPLLTIVPAIFVLSIVPFGPPVRFSVLGRELTVPLGITDLPVGILFYFAVTGVAIYGIVLAGWASNSKYSLLGGIRASAQMLSYEIALGLSLIGVLLIAGTFNLRELIGQQDGGFWNWNVWKQPVGFGIFLLAGFAETNRLPFDLAEGESELGGGFHTEYSSMKFAMFFMAEYMNMFTFGAILATLFLGGYTGPVPSPFAPFSVANALWGLLWFTLKVLLIICFFIFIRGTWPRFRYDQLMDLGWKVMFPLALVNVVLTAGIVAFVPAPPVGAAPAAIARFEPWLTAVLLAAGLAQIIIVDRILDARRKRLYHVG